MSLLSCVQKAEQIVGYQFSQKEKLIQALKSPGAEENDHDGNQVLARLGKPLIELYASQMKFTTGARAGMHRSYERLTYC